MTIDQTHCYAVSPCHQIIEPISDEIFLCFYAVWRLDESELDLVHFHIDKPLYHRYTSFSMSVKRSIHNYLIRLPNLINYLNFLIYEQIWPTDSKWVLLCMSKHASHWQSVNAGCKTVPWLGKPIKFSWLISHSTRWVFWEGAALSVCTNKRIIIL